MIFDARAALDNPLRVTIDGLGEVVGAREERAIAFHGIPYAQPVVGARRFSPPEPVTAWEGTLDATARGPIAPQPPAPSEGIMGQISLPQDEDCLSLTIWTPAEGRGPWPVIAWLHGGGFTTGGGDLPWYDGGLLAAEQNVIVVGINYRLGALGYLHVPGTVPGNLAVQDQQLGLEWIRDNIAAFGGDPDRVTAMGESGGAHNIAMLLAIRPERSLFHRAILQSAPLGIGLASREEAAFRAGLFLDELGLAPDATDLAQQLRALPVEALITALRGAGPRLPSRAPGDLRPFFLPVEDEFGVGSSTTLLTRAAETAAALGIELLMGWNRDEATFFLGANPQVARMTEEQLRDSVCRTWEERGECLIASAALANPNARPGERFIAVVSDAVFRSPVLTLADKIQEAGGSAYVYQFDWSSPDPALGACHCIDLPFVFGTFAAFAGGRMIGGASTDAALALGETIRRRWGEFAWQRTTGFPSWTADQRPICHLNSEIWIEALGRGDEGRGPPDTE